MKLPPLILVVGIACLVLGVYSLVTESGTSSIIPTAIPTANDKAISVPLANPWTSTGITIKAGQTVNIAATGKGVWKNISGKNPNAYPKPYEECDPNGTPPVDSKDYYSNMSSYPTRDAYKGALIGRIGENGKPFKVGSQFNQKINETGTLYLGINDMKPEVDASSFADNSGSYSVTIQIINPANNTLSVPFQNYTRAQWDEYKPGYDGTSFEQASHLWMRAKGQITYLANIIDQPSSGAVSVSLSSELNKTTSTNPNDSSDVTLIVNGKQQKTINVIPDNLIGSQYTWDIPAGVLKSGNNEITFKVGDGSHNNGLTIYSPVTVRY